MLKGTNVRIPATLVRVDIGWRTGPGVPGTDACALLLTAGGVRSGADVVSARRPVHVSGAVRHDGRRASGDAVTETLHIDLAAAPSAVEGVVLAATTDGGAFARVPGLYVRIADAATGAELARFDSRDATVETALVLGELYRRHGEWKFRAVGQGYADGAAGLAADHGLADRTAIGPAATVPGPPQAAPQTAPRPVPPPATVPPRPVKVTLTKETPTVSLAKQGGTSGVLHVNLNWHVRSEPQGWGRRLGAALQPALDLDLGALFELTDGTKGAVQALGNAFGSLHGPPWIHLDGDDRTGAVETGENLTVNLDHSADFRRILVFVTIYEGARSFAGLHATVTLRPGRGAPVDFSLDECTVPSNVCALALITHQNGELVVRREARYLVPDRGVSPQRTLDRAYGWGLTWAPGRK
ncbi:TerD family protein [Streptomyces sp. NPDC049577]|uniref:TerD family protein n=1 Tax=Streptomyces sp. NPDC049577 TaxID=3155153 RepID=UPI003435EECA